VLLSVWDWVLGTRLNVFLNQRPFGSRPTALKLINEDDLGLLAIGSDDGVLRIFRNYESPDKVELLTSWRALTDLSPGTHHKGLLLDWQQASGSFLVSGDVRTVRVWDAEKELCIQDIPTRTLASVSTLTSDKTANTLVVAGFTDGFIRIYDRRLAAKDRSVWRRILRTEGNLIRTVFSCAAWWLRWPTVLRWLGYSCKKPGFRS
jgi:regulator-associated protein of mTOR